MHLQFLLQVIRLYEKIRVEQHFQRAIRQTERRPINVGTLFILGGILASTFIVTVTQTCGNGKSRAGVVSISSRVKQ